MTGYSNCISYIVEAKKQGLGSRKIAKELEVTMIIVTHEIGFAKEVADQVVFMEGGVIVEQGDPKVVLEHPKEERTRKFLSRYLTLDSELPLDSAAL